MNPREITVLLATTTSALGQAEATIDRLIASADPESSYAATTAGLHLHAAQGELAALSPDTATQEAYEPSATEPGLLTNPEDVANVLADMTALVRQQLGSIPAAQQACAARAALHLAEAADALRGTPP